jgi:hypothetical protein
VKVYLSSTYVDLKQHCASLARALRKARYEVVMMEEYVARDARVEFACTGDVVACDTYVGLFAWRHGYVPPDDNPDGLSVTEMEYAAADAKPMPRLTFLLEDKARWPAQRKDVDLTYIQALRERLKKRCSGRFGSAHELAVEVLAALRVLESSSRAERLLAVQEIVRAQEFGPSYMLNLKDQLRTLSEYPFIELQLAPTPWWNTRLYLVAALAQEMGGVRGIIFTDDQGRFVKSSAPGEIRRRLGQRWPALDAAYAAFRNETPTLPQLDANLWRYPMHAATALGQAEDVGRHIMSVEDITDELGMASNAEIVDVEGKDQRFLQREILGRRSPYVALLRDERLPGLTDRARLAEKVAQAALAMG